MTGITEAQELAEKVADYLEGLPDTYAAPVVVKIGRSVYPGASYVKVLRNAEGTLAYSSGERWYSSGGMYLLGELPYSYRRRKATHYRIPGAPFIWYVAGWYDKSEPNPYHPFGRMFILMLDRRPEKTDHTGAEYRDETLQLIG